MNFEKTKYITYDVIKIGENEYHVEEPVYDLLCEMKEEIEVLREGLETYANEDNWGFTERACGSRAITFKQFDEEMRPRDFYTGYVGGKTARETLNKANEIRDKE